MAQSDARTPKWSKQPWISLRAASSASLTRASSGAFISKFFSVGTEAAATCNAARLPLQALVEWSAQCDVRVLSSIHTPQEARRLSQSSPPSSSFRNVLRGIDTGR